MRRAASVCLIPGCLGTPYRDGRCREHAPTPWAGSHERRILIVSECELARLRKRVRRRARGRCESCGRRITTGRGHVDHVHPITLRPDLAADHRHAQLLCAECHERKTEWDRELIRAAQSVEAGRVERSGIADHASCAKGWAVPPPPPPP
jgi:5-methylcytosine-specific restriction endonuclease McrA